MQSCFVLNNLLDSHQPPPSQNTIKFEALAPRPGRTYSAAGDPSREMAPVLTGSNIRGHVVAASFNLMKISSASKKNLSIYGL